MAQIKNRLYEREGTAVNNFSKTLPAPQSDLAKQIVKAPYNFDFLTLSKNVEEQDLKRALVKHMRDFLLELGLGFAFIGHNYPLTVGEQDFHIDLLFYHLELRCFVVIELEMGDFKPEYSGMMNFYIAAIDDSETQRVRSAHNRHHLVPDPPQSDRGILPQQPAQSHRGRGTSLA
ncbi:MAG: PDDEXK nuclease domain-containing protein [Cyanobacteria bacterium P01_D01_bin.115]